MALKSLARPDRRMISPPAAPVAYSVVRPLIYTAGPLGMQGHGLNLWAEPGYCVHGWPEADEARNPLAEHAGNG